MSNDQVSKDVSEKAQAVVDSVKAEVNEVKETVATTTTKAKRTVTPGNHYCSSSPRYHQKLLE